MSVVLERHPDYVIDISLKKLMEMKEEIEDDVDDKMGWRRHREVLEAHGLVLKEVKLIG